MTATVTASMQAALLIRQKQKLRAKKPRHELPSNVATKDIAPFPQFPPNTWVCYVVADIHLFIYV